MDRLDRFIVYWKSQTTLQNCTLYVRTVVYMNVGRKTSVTFIVFLSKNFIRLMYCTGAGGDKIFKALAYKNGSPGKAVRTDRPSQYKSHLPGHSPPELSRTPCRASPLYSSQLPGQGIGMQLPSQQVQVIPPRLFSSLLAGQDAEQGRFSSFYHLWITL